MRIPEIKKWQPLKHGDIVEVVAPASRCSAEVLSKIKALLDMWGLKTIIPTDIFGEDLLCANSDEKRFKHLKKALLNPASKAIFCAKGGYGSARLIPMLSELDPPPQPKLFVGMSDLTALNIFFQQKWHWSPVHAAAVPGRFDENSLHELHEVIFHNKTLVDFPPLTPLNKAAKKTQLMHAVITGGNLALVEASIGTAWQLDATNKFILLEETNERAYRVDRMLIHLLQAGIFNNAAAIIFGDFSGGNEPNGVSLIPQVLQRFADDIHIPVLKCEGIGHGVVNHPVPLGLPFTLQLGKQSSLQCDLNQ